MNPLAFRVRTERFKTLVILDEVHHAGDALSWGEGVREAFDPATRRLSLTGTPFRSDQAAIPGVRYDGGPDEGSRGVISSMALSVGADILRRIPVDWSDIGVEDKELEGLAEILMRLFASYQRGVGPGSPRSAPGGCCETSWAMAVPHSK